MDISIIIVNYNVYDDVKNTLGSISNILKDVNFEIILLDNNSTDKTIRETVNEYNNIKYIQLDKNLGFGKANNIGVRNAKGEFILLLNPDTLLIEDFITPITAFINFNQNAAACAPMLVYKDEKYQSSSGFSMGFIYEFLEATMLIELYRKFKESKYLSLKNSNEPVKVGWVSGACFIIRRSVFEEVGGFTEDYFLNYEDIDLCRKLEDMGYSNFYFSQYKCIHLDHKSFNKNYSLLVYSRYRSKLVYAKCHYGFVKGLLVRLLHITGIMFRIFLVNFIYSGLERKSRLNGYYASLALYVTGNGSIKNSLEKQLENQI
jgi:GT2 family glycosyltransferase